MAVGSSGVGRLEDVLEPLLRDLGVELWLVERSRQGGRVVLRLLIDRPGGVDLDACQRVSKAVSRSERIDELAPADYVLEVSSPGLDRPLVKPDHFRRFEGHKISFKLKAPRNGVRKFTGVLTGADDENFSLVTDTGSESFDYAEVTLARLVFEPE